MRSITRPHPLLPGRHIYAEFLKPNSAITIEPDRKMLQIFHFKESRNEAKPRSKALQERVQLITTALYKDVVDSVVTIVLCTPHSHIR